MDLLLPSGTDALLRDLVHERAGIFYDEEKSPLFLEKLSTLVIDRGFQSFLDYYYLLRYDDRNDQEWNRVIDAITVQETYFWREIDQIRALVDILLPHWISEGRTAPLRIWSAACATGEEPLSIAMALNETGWFQRIPIEIWATDASGAALEKARAGLYHERAFRNLPATLRARYFCREDGGWQVDPALHRRINWAQANLINRAEVAPFASAPFIMCRNVFIYFSESMIRRAVKTFADHIQSPGYLFVGVAESLLKVSNEFELTDIGKAFVYQRSDLFESTLTTNQKVATAGKGYA